MRFIIFFLFLLYSTFGFSQTTYPINQYFGSTSTLTNINGAGKAAHGFINGVYPDTLTANSSSGYLRFYPGAQIMAGDSFYLRDITGTKWLLINGTGGGGGSGTLTNITGVNANGFAWSISNPTTTPALTLSTNQTGLLYGNGTSMTGTLLSADFVITSNVLYNQNWVNVVDYGADPTGVSNSVTAFALAIATGKNVFVPAGTYLLTGTANTSLLTLNAGQKIYGVGQKSIIRTTSNARIIEIEEFCEIENIYFQGTASKFTSSLANQSAIFLSTDDTAWTIRGCRFDKFGGDGSFVGGAIYAAAIANNATVGGTILSCQFFDNYNAILVKSRAEYINIIACKISSNNLGVLNNAGNTLLNGSTLEFNVLAYSLTSTTNDGHCVVSASQFNHNTTDLSVVGITNGFVFNGFLSYAGNVVITNSTGVRFVGSDFSTGTMTLTNNTNIQRVASRYHNMTTNVVSGEDFSIIGDIREGSTPNYWLKQITADSIQFFGPMYHTGTPGTSTSSANSVWVRESNQFKLTTQANLRTGLTDLDFGDFTVVSNVATIDNSVVTYAKIQNVTQARLLGRHTASTGIVQEISIGSGLSLDAGTGVLSATAGGSTFIGLTDVPASYSGQALKVVRVNGAETALEFVTLAGGGDALTADPLSQFAATTSAQLAGVMTNETGTGVLVYNNGPQLLSPKLETTSTIGHVWTATDANGNGSWQAAGGGALNLSYDATNHEVDISGGGTSAVIPLSVDDGATEGLASFTAADFTVTSGNVAIDYANGQAASGSVNGFTTTGAQTFAGVKTYSSSPVFSVGLQTSATAINSNLYVPSASGATSSSDAGYTALGSSTTAFRVGFRGTTSTTLGNGMGYANIVAGGSPITETASGSVPFATAALFKTFTVTNGAGGTAILAGIIVEGPPTGVTPTTDSYGILVNSGKVTLTNGNLDLNTAGNKINIATGSNASVGVSGAMTAGSITISTTAVTANSKIFLTHASVGGTVGVLSVGTITAGTSFVINSSSGTDTSTVNWWILN